MQFVHASQVQASTNEVVDHFAALEAKLRIEILEGSEVLIEGDKESLEFLANYILAYVNGDEHARNINLEGAGSLFFREGSTHGFYLHILPCRHGHPE